jgi:hypothetical protein
MACGAGEILLDRRTAVRGALPLREEVVRPQRTAKAKAKARRVRAPCHSQCIAHWGACGKTRVVLQNLRAKPEPAAIRDSRSTCALVDVWVSRDVEPPVGLAVRLRALEFPPENMRYAYR